MVFVIETFLFDSLIFFIYLSLFIYQLTLMVKYRVFVRCVEELKI